MSRVLPRRSRGGSRRGERPSSRRETPPAFIETDDPQPAAQPTPQPTAKPAAEPVPEAAPAPEPAPAPVAAPLPPTVSETADPDLPALTAATELDREAREHPRRFVDRHRPLLAGAWLLVAAAGLACLVLALLGVGPDLLDETGAVVVLTAYTWALATRTGGRPVVFSTVAAVASVGVLLSDQPSLRTGAAVMTCCIAAVLALVATVPATTYARVVRESVVAVLIAGVGALATLGFSPTISLVRFEYATLALSLLGAFAVVYRLGAGLHGLGRRGVLAVLLGGAVLVITLIYAETLRRYGPPETVDVLVDAVRWCREHLGAFPRPVAAVLGFPALAWGVHMRARRRQGWWVCAFGAAGTAAVASSLLNPAITYLECGLSILYGLLVGLAVGWVLVRIDLALGGTGAGGRRADDHAAARPEPPRTASLL